MLAKGLLRRYLPVQQSLLADISSHALRNSKPRHHINGHGRQSPHQRSNARFAVEAWRLEQQEWERMQVVNSGVVKGFQSAKGPKPTTLIFADEAITFIKAHTSTSLINHAERDSWIV